MILFHGVEDLEFLIASCPDGIKAEARQRLADRPVGYVYEQCWLAPGARQRVTHYGFDAATGAVSTLGDWYDAEGRECVLDGDAAGRLVLRPKSGGSPLSQY